ncbi:MAG: NAD(P)/FAD-dependent oxidoreductase [Acidobacteriota bacterium]
MKVIIAGASTSGLFAAYLLAKAGVEVEVFERSAAIDPAVRTLIVTDKINEVLGFVPHEIILNEVKHIDLFSKSRSSRMELDRPDLIIAREKLILMLARMAEEAGVKIALKRRFLSFASGRNAVAVSYKDLETGEEKRQTADFLIGADGVYSAVAKAASYNGHFQTALLQARVKLPKGVARDTYQVWFDRERTKYFYWLIPESDEIAAVGLIADDPRQGNVSLKSFLDEQGWQPLEYQASMVPMHKYEYSAKVKEVSRRVFLVGDSTAQVKVTTVGGVVTGFRGVRAVVEAILEGKSIGKESRGLKRELDLHLLVRKVLDGFSDADYDLLIDFIEGQLKGVLSAVTRDDLARMYLKLVTSQPRLVMLGAKGLLRGIG